MHPDDESPNPPGGHDVAPDVQSVTTHSWLQHGDTPPSSWAPPSPSTTPQPPAPAAVPSTAPPAPPAMTPVPAPPPTRPDSGDDAPEPDITWDAYLQRASLPVQPATDRPAVQLAGILLVAGAALAIAGSVLTWATFPDAAVNPFIPRTINGFTEIAGESRDGPFFVAFGAILAVFGVTLLLAKRVTAILILGLILAGFGAAAGVIDLLDIADPDGVPAALQPSVGIGLPVVIGGFVVAFAGSVVGLRGGRRAG